MEFPQIDRHSKFYRACRQRRASGAELCKQCPFHEGIEMQERKVELTQEMVDLPVSTLEQYGLPIRIIGILENKLKAFFIRDLQRFDGMDLQEHVPGIGPTESRRVALALVFLKEDLEGR